jgi:hypothetical protein
MKSLSVTKLEPFMAQGLAKDTVKMLEEFQCCQNSGVRTGCWQVAFCFLTNGDYRKAISDDYTQLLPITRNLLGPQVHEFINRIVAKNVGAWLWNSGLLEEYDYERFPYFDFHKLPEIVNITSCID